MASAGSSALARRGATYPSAIDLERLLLAKEMLEQMLIYARYGAKARG